MVTLEKLIQFEKEIGDLFDDKQIRAPIHLYNGNESHMMEIFNDVDSVNDWVCCTWRNHYQALLKGIPENLLKNEILKGKSMVMNLPEYKFICSSIVGGIPSIAAGLAVGENLKKTNNKVWCWVGDMSAETGAFHEAYKYAKNNKLPINYIIECNNKSVMTPTDETWNRTIPYFIDDVDLFLKTMSEKGIYKQENLWYYEYDNTKYPHAGAGKRVQF